MYATREEPERSGARGAKRRRQSVAQKEQGQGAGVQPPILGAQGGGHAERGETVKKMETKDKVMAALLCSLTEKEAAEKAGVTDRTVRNYLADEDFYREYSKRRRKLVGSAAGALQKSMVAAAVTLDCIMRNSEKVVERMAAAKCILDYGLRYTELNDLFDRVDAALEVLKGEE